MERWLRAEELDDEPPLYIKDLLVSIGKGRSSYTGGGNEMSVWHDSSGAH
jgi:hypothetical protein